MRRSSMHHVALLVELARNRVRHAARSPSTPKAPAGSPASTRRTACRRGPVSAFRSCAPFASATSVNWLGMTYFSASACASTNALCSSASFFWVASHRLQVFGLVGVVRRLHLCQSNLLGRVILGPDLARALEGQVLEHVRQSALARGVVHVARIDQCVVAEHRRFGPLANDQREPVGQHLHSDLFLQLLEVRGKRALAIRSAPGGQSQHHTQKARQPTGEKLRKHPISFFHSISSTRAATLTPEGSNRNTL